jgi:membrane peptidoglycan carboxypeptidase
MSKNTGRKRGGSNNTVTTRSGKTIKVNRSLADRKKARKAEHSAAKAAYLASLPKERWKRWLVRMEPKHLAQFWFSREGGIMLLKLIGASVVVCFFLTVGLFAYFRKDLPQIKDLSGNLGGSISYYDSTGKVLLFNDYNSVKRDPVASNQISPYMKEATVAIEDKNFYKEGAFDVRGILRAAFNDVKGGSSLQGGSTITQQLVKLDEGWTNNRTITRKVKELILAVELERQYSKNDILTGYLNVAPYGGLDYGVQAASEDYFNVSAKDLTLAQASMLASIPQSPSYYSPYAGSQFNPAVTYGTFSAQALLVRQHYVLEQMYKQGYISLAQEKAAIAVNVLAEVKPEQSKYQNIQAPYFVLAAKQQLIAKYGASTVAHGGWKVITTLNLGLQSDAEQDVANNVKNVAAVGGNQEAMVAEDVQTGQVVAQVGGEDFSPTYPGGEINYSDTLISPGSSLKPFVYAALIQNNNNVGAGSYFYDSQQALPGYPCTNKAQPTTTSAGGNCLWDDNYVYPGPETLRYALAGSRNVPAVKASYEVVPASQSALIGGGNGVITQADVKSVNKWISMANSATGYNNAYSCYAGVSSLLAATAADRTQCYGSAAIGSGDIAIDKEVNGDATLARLGQEIPQTYILNITDSSGKTIYQWKQPKATQVYSPDTAYIVDSMLDDPNATYLQPYQKFQHYNGWDIAVKTGTENDSRNGVMTAWSTQYAVVGFAGSANLSKQLTEGHFEDITEPITKTWMEQALTALNTKATNWTPPKDVKTQSAYVQRAFADYGAVFPGPSTDLYPSWYVGGSGSSSGSTSQVIDKVSGLIATSCTPALARETIGSTGKQNLDVDLFNGGTSDIGVSKSSTKTSAGTDNVHNCNDSPPTVTLTAPSTCNDTSCPITATVTQGTHPFVDPQYPDYPGAITFTLNGKQIDKQNVSTSPDTVTFNYNPTSSGSGTLTATVTDSVLYSGTDSASLNYTAPSAITNVSFSPSSGSQSPTVSWSGGSGSYTVTSSSGSSCPPTTATSCQIILPATGTYTITVSDDQGDSSGSAQYTSTP